MFENRCLHNEGLWFDDSGPAQKPFLNGTFVIWRQLVEGYAHSLIQAAFVIDPPDDGPGVYSPLAPRYSKT